MAQHTRAPLLLFGNEGNPPTAVATGANATSDDAYIGWALNAAIFIQNGDAVNSSVFTLQAAPNFAGAPGRNYTPSSNTGWFNVLDAVTDTPYQWTVAAQTSVCVLVPNIAATQIRLTSATALSSCLAIVEGSV